MGEPCCWHMKARGRKEDVIRFGKLMYNREINGKGAGFRPSSVTDEEMHDYGYGMDWDGMFPLSAWEAKRLFENGLPVMRLYQDNTEGYVENLADLEEHEKAGGMFGIEKASLYSEDMRGIAGAAYSEYPSVEGLEEMDDGTWVIDIHGDSKYSLSPMTDEGTTREDGEPLVTLNEAAKELSLLIEVFGDAYCGLQSMDFHLLVAPDGKETINEERMSMHEWLDSFDDDEEFVETARPVLEEMGKPLPEDTDEARRALDEYIDEDEYVDIRPFEWEFTIC